MTQKYKDLFDRYRVIEKVKKELHDKSEKQALAELNSKINEINDNWSNYSYDCCGHAHTCLHLMIDCINNGYHRTPTDNES